MAERNQVFESRMHAQLVVNAHRAVKSDGGRGVDADERHVHVFQTTDLIRVDVERADDDRVLEVEFACGGEDSVTCLRQHKIRLGEGS